MLLALEQYAVIRAQLAHPTTSLRSLSGNCAKTSSSNAGFRCMPPSAFDMIGMFTAPG
jgi:hypothetical protein